MSGSTPLAGPTQSTHSVPLNNVFLANQSEVSLTCVQELCGLSKLISSSVNNRGLTPDTGPAQ
jgi:hypothetical protein